MADTPVSGQALHSDTVAVVPDTVAVADIAAASLVRPDSSTLVESAPCIVAAAV